MNLARLHQRLCMLGSVLVTVACSNSQGTPGPTTDAGAAVTEIYDCSSPDRLTAPSIRGFINRLTHSGSSYTTLTTAGMNGLIRATRALDQGDIAGALTAAATVDYRVQSLKVASTCYWVLQPRDARVGEHGTLIYAPHWTRDLVIEAPHVPEDHHTDREAAELFDKLHAKALIIAGAGRCATAEPSNCRPSKQCNPAGVAVQSDPSHSIRTSLHAMHLALASGETVLLQLHTNVPTGLYGQGNALHSGSYQPNGSPKIKRGDGGTLLWSGPTWNDAFGLPVFEDGKEVPSNGDALVSNGTRYPAPGSAADRLYQALKAPDVDIRSCNDKATPALSNALCGETNTQGLVSNRVADTCLGRATERSVLAGGSHFVHLEQSSFRTCAVSTPGATGIVADAGSLADAGNLADAGDVGMSDGNPLCIDDVYVWTERVRAALAKAIPESR